MKCNLNKEAKELFFEYNCDHFLMTRAQDNAYEKYNSFHVPKEQENLWRQEYQNNLIDEIRNEKNMQELVWKIHQLCDCIDQNNNLNVLELLLEFLEKKSIDYDSFSKVIISEAMINFVKKTTVIDSEGVKEIEKCKSYACNLAQSIIADEISIDSGYYKLDYLEGDLTPEKILARANNVIRAFD